MIDLLLIFQSLGLPASSKGLQFTALPMPGYEAHRVGKDVGGCPVLLVSVSDSGQVSVPASIILEHLIVQHDMLCRVHHPDGQTEVGSYTVIRCTDADLALQKYFLEVAAPILVSFGISPTMLEVSKAVHALAELFTAMTGAPRKSVQGLWAELFVVTNATRPGHLIGAWHAAPEDCYDFDAAGQRLEVKSSVLRVRQHHFRLEQLWPPLGAEVLIASVLVERAGGGVSLGDLYKRVRLQVAANPELLSRLDRIVALTLGDSWRSAFEDAFDWQLAEASLAFFEPSAIPRIDAAVPLGVTQVQFVSDLTGIPQVDTNNCRAKGGLFEAAMAPSDRHKSR